MARCELELIRRGEVVRVVGVAGTPVTFGRALSNTVVLLDDDVSKHHAVVAIGPNGVYVEDLQSKNGTFVNDQSITLRATLRDGDRLRLGTEVELRVREVREPSAALLVLEHLDAGTAYVLKEDRFHIGSGEDCGVRLPDGPAHLGTLMLYETGEIWLGTKGEDAPLEIDVPFSLGGQRFCLRSSPTSSRETSQGRTPPRYPYAVSATLDGPGGAVATVRHLREGASHTVTAVTRATLIYILARQRQGDLESGRLEVDAGWCDDEAVIVGVWGRAGLRQTASNFSVAIHRLRKELEDAGFDPWFVEKRRGAIRLRVTDIELR